MPTKRIEFVQSIRTQYLGERMRELRDERGLTLKYVAGYLGVEFSTLARYERAEWPFRRDHVSALLDVYGVYDENERRDLTRLAENAWRADHWWRDDVNPDAALGAVPDRWWVHDRAKEICVYNPTVVPQLVQNAAYLDEVMARAQTGRPVPEEERKKRVYDIGLRTTALHGRDRNKTPTLRVVVDERVLRWPVAGTAALRAQLQHLVDLVRKLPNVGVRVIREGAAVHPGIYGAFTVYRMPPPYPPVAVVEHCGGALLIEGKAAEHYNAVFEHLATVIAESDTESIALINTTMEDL
jgi:transcriptional regulator with XRE-family HTH domain